MRKNSTITALICGLSAMFATIIFYLLAFDNIFTIPMRWLSLTGLLLVEIVGTVKALTVSRSILSVTQIIIGGIHLAATLVISIIFVNLLPLLIKEYILLSILMFIVVAVVDILLLHFNTKAQNAAQSYTAAAIVLDMCEAKARQLWIDNKEAVFAHQLEAIVELLTYTNRAVATPNDSELVAKIDDLAAVISNSEIDKISDVAKQIQNTLKLRVELTKKSGSF